MAATGSSGTDDAAARLRESLYTAVGFGVLGFQQAQVRRRQLQRELSRLAAEVDERVEPVLDDLQARLSDEGAPARGRGPLRGAGLLRLAASGGRVTEPLKGRLLVATPNLGDPNFERTVVLILAHGDEGALGVVLNRPSQLDLAEPLPEWARAAADPPVIFIGGPVAPSAAVCLARVAPAGGAVGWEPLLGPVGTLDLDSDPDEAIPRVQGIRVFAGYAGWGPGQLEGEIEAGGWFVVDADAADALSPAPEGLWAAVLRRQRGSLALFAAYPTDPTLN